MILSGDRPGEFNTSDPLVVLVLPTKSVTVPHATAHVTATDAADGKGVGVVPVDVAVEGVTLAGGVGDTVVGGTCARTA